VIAPVVKPSACIDSAIVVAFIEMPGQPWMDVS
jgi:hypothetical protein